MRELFIFSYGFCLGVAMILYMGKPPRGKH